MDGDKSKNTSSLRSGMLSREFALSTILVTAFICVSGVLVLQLQNADRAEDREDKARLALESLDRIIPDKTVKAEVLRGAIIAKQAKLARIQEGYSQLLDSKKQAEEVIAARNQASQEYSDLTVRIDAAETSLQELQATRDQLIAIIQNGRKKRDVEREEVCALQRKRENLTTDVRDLELKKKELTRIEQNVAKLEGEQRKLTEQNLDVSDQISAAQKTHINLRAQVAGIRSQVTTLTTSFRNKQTENKMLHDELIRSREQAAILRAKVRGLTEEETVLLRLQQSVANAKAEQRNIHASLTEMEDEKQKVETDLLGMTSKLLAAKRRLEQITEREEAIRTKEVRLGDLDVTIMQRQADLDELEKLLKIRRLEAASLSAELRADNERKARVKERERQVTTREEAVSIKETSLENQND